MWGHTIHTTILSLKPDVPHIHLLVTKMLNLLIDIRKNCQKSLDSLLLKDILFIFESSSEDGELANDPQEYQEGVQAKADTHETNGSSDQPRSNFESIVANTDDGKEYRCLDCDFTTNHLRNLNGER